MKILALGDVFGDRAVEYLSSSLWKIKKELNIDMAVANCENANGASGCLTRQAEALLSAGCDVLTGGNHTLREEDLYTALEREEFVLRPENIPDAVGKGYAIKDVGGKRVLVVSLIGRLLTEEKYSSPFDALEEILRKEKGNYDISVVDIHAEATSEKAAVLYGFCGRVSAIFGTHTHVATADERIVCGTGFITDLGMCGPYDSILGVKPEIIVSRLRDGGRDRFKTAEGRIEVRGAVFDIDGSGKCLSVKRVKW